jgi:hypothetical protein
VPKEKRTFDKEALCRVPNKALGKEASSLSVFLQSIFI